MSADPAPEHFRRRWASCITIASHCESACCLLWSHLTWQWTKLVSVVVAGRVRSDLVWLASPLMRQPEVFLSDPFVSLLQLAQPLAVFCRSQLRRSLWTDVSALCVILSCTRFSMLSICTVVALKMILSVQPPLNYMLASKILLPSTVFIILRDPLLLSFLGII